MHIILLSKPYNHNVFPFPRVLCITEKKLNRKNELTYFQVGNGVCGHGH